MKNHWLQLYTNNIAHEDKSVVLLSSGFLQTYNTTTNRNLFWILEKDYNVYGIDNVWHGKEKINKFTIDNQEKLLLDVIWSIDNPVHIISNSFPWMFTIAALYNILRTDQEALLTQKIKSLTLIAPTINPLWALDDDFATRRNFIVQELYKYGWSRKSILNFILNNVKWVNADLDMLYNWAKDDMRFRSNLKTILRVSNNIPTHIVFNTWDKAVLTQEKDSDKEILEYLQTNRFPNVGYTYNNTDRHAVYLQDQLTKSNVIDNNFTMGDSIKEFINKNDKKLLK